MLLFACITLMCSSSWLCFVICFLYLFGSCIGYLMYCFVLLMYCSWLHCNAHVCACIAYVLFCDAHDCLVLLMFAHLLPMYGSWYLVTHWGQCFNWGGECVTMMNTSSSSSSLLPLTHSQKVPKSEIGGRIRRESRKLILSVLGEIQILDTLVC